MRSTAVLLLVALSSCSLLKTSMPARDINGPVAAPCTQPTSPPKVDVVLGSLVAVGVIGFVASPARQSASTSEIVGTALGGAGLVALAAYSAVTGFRNVAACEQGEARLKVESALEDQARRAREMAAKQNEEAAISRARETPAEPVSVTLLNQHTEVLLEVAFEQPTSKERGQVLRRRLTTGETARVEVNLRPGHGLVLDGVVTSMGVRQTTRPFATTVEAGKSLDLALDYDLALGAFRLRGEWRPPPP